MYLRHPALRDFDELERRYGESRSHLKHFASSSFTKEVFDRKLTDAEKDSNEFFLICRVDDDAIIGTINLSQIFRRSFQNAYLGYQLFAGFTGKGFMTEAVALVIRFAFVDLKLHRIEANVQPNNSASIRVLERNGFINEGFSKRYLKIGGKWRDHERWAIIKENWNNSRINVHTEGKKRFHTNT